MLHQTFAQISGMAVAALVIVFTAVQRPTSFRTFLATVSWNG